MDLFLHIDEIDDNDTAYIAQPELIGDFLHRLHVGLENGFFKIVFSDKTSRIDINHRQGLGSLDDNVAAAAQPDLFVKGAAYLHLNTVGLENRLLSPVEVYLVEETRGKGLDKTENPVIGLLIIHNNPVDLGRKDIPHHPQDNIQIGID